MRSSKGRQPPPEETPTVFATPAELVALAEHGWRTSTGGWLPLGDRDRDPLLPVCRPVAEIDQLTCRFLELVVLAGHYLAGGVQKPDVDASSKTGNELGVLSTTSMRPLPSTLPLSWNVRAASPRLGFAGHCVTPVTLRSAATASRIWCATFVLDGLTTVPAKTPATALPPVPPVVWPPPGTLSSSSGGGTVKLLSAASTPCL